MTSRNSCPSASPTKTLDADGLIAFVNYQARVVTGLRMLKGE